jgi:hypothetical protein
MLTTRLRLLRMHVVKFHGTVHPSNIAPSAHLERNVVAGAGHILAPLMAQIREVTRCNQLLWYMCQGVSSCGFRTSPCGFRVMSETRGRLQRRPGVHDWGTQAARHFVVTGLRTHDVVEGWPAQNPYGVTCVHVLAGHDLQQSGLACTRTCTRVSSP